MGKLDNARFLHYKLMFSLILMNGGVPGTSVQDRFPMKAQLARPERVD